MNYTKHNLEKETKKSNSKKAKRRRAILGKVFKSFFIFVILLVIGFGGLLGLYVKQSVDTMPDASTIDISPSGFLTTVYDAEGNEIEKLASSGANRSYVTLDEIPDHLEHAFVAIEDERFYTHNGVDPRGMLRALATAVSSGGERLQGASTITQQLLKNNYFTTWTDENTLADKVDRKIKEQYLAIELEKVVTKDTILENYLNTINLGQNTLGVEAASERYFNKPVSELTISESAVIAGITQNPSRYNPISNPEENTNRRKAVLDKMLSLEYITQEQYDEAMADDVYSRIMTENSNIESSTTSYFVDALVDQVIEDLMEEKNYSEEQAYQVLYSGGLSIESTQDPRIQAIVDEEVNNADNYGTGVQYSFSYRLTVQKADGTTANYSEQTMLSYYKADNKDYNINFSSPEECDAAIAKYKEDIMTEGDTIVEGGEYLTYTLQPQAAMVVIDQNNGRVVGLVGGRGEKMASRTLNRATSITRQPGSCFKILGCYTAALDAGGMTLATVQDDAPMSYANGNSLQNYDNVYRGMTTIREAIRMSRNVVTVKNLTEIGTSLGYNYAENLGITTLDPLDNSQALCLGGLSYGVKVIDLAGAYATIANGGTYYRPVLYTKVYDHDGNVILDTTEEKGSRELKETTSWLLTSAMQDVVASGTGGGAAVPNQATAGKTGTTNEDRDTLFAGYTPHYTAAIWGGFDDNSPQSATRYSKTIWQSSMARIHEGLESRTFEQPSDIVTATVCSKSGKLAIPGICENHPTGSTVITEYFDKDSVPTESCDHHKVVGICNDTGHLASNLCTSVTLQVRLVDVATNTSDGEYAVDTSNLCELHGGTSAYYVSDEDIENIGIGDTIGGSTSNDNSSGLNGYSGWDGFNNGGLNGIDDFDSSYTPGFDSGTSGGGGLPSGGGGSSGGGSSGGGSSGSSGNDP